MKNAIEKIAGMTYGCEIEYTGISRMAATKAVAAATGGTYYYKGLHLDNWEVTMPDGRKWQVESDASVTGSSTDHGGEVVTPILTMADMPMLQKVVRALREAGAKTNKTCGGHIHVGAKDMTARQIQNLVKIFYKQERLLTASNGTQQSRLDHYTRYTDRIFVERISQLKNPTMDAINKAWFGYFNPNPAHYDSCRYRTLNLNNLWGRNAKKTIELRFFEGTLHAGELRTNVLLALTLVAFAKEAKSASAKNQREYKVTSGKYDMRIFLLRLGWIGDEFKNPRMHMMKRVGGSAAWKDGTAHGRGAGAAGAEVAA